VRRSAGKAVVTDAARKQSIETLKSDNPFAGLTIDPAVDEPDISIQQREYRKKMKRQHQGITRPGDDHR
jgi:hypothetical protein